MPAPKDQTMLKANSIKVLTAMAVAEMEPKDLAKATEIPINTIYILRRGYYVKPKYIGKVAKALNVAVADLIEDKEVQLDTIHNSPAT